MIEKLFNKYTNPLFISQMYAQNSSFFMEFAKAWPQFLRNPALLSQLTKIQSKSILVNEQSETLKILSKKNVLHPELLDIHFQTFIRMKDRKVVQGYLD